MVKTILHDLPTPESRPSLCSSLPDSSVERELAHIPLNRGGGYGCLASAFCGTLVLELTVGVNRPYRSGQGRGGFPYRITRRCPWNCR